ncbi:MULTISPECIES: lipopolysaccharide biosynthesis protein [unclassified Leucobacter]|uniref:lipopolysaccharide biosynthesis protein n=1 Tax=unclassified Leucobacter TaxID=2621730 RepID=UPI003016E143
MTAVATPVREERGLGRRSLLSFAGSATSALLGFLLVVVLARFLGDADSGIVLQAIAVFMIALGFARFGMDSTAVWLLPRLADDEPQQLRATAWFLIAVSGVAGSLCAVVVWIGAGIAAQGNPADPLPPVVRVSAVFLPIAAMLLTALAVSRALGRIAEYVLIGGVGLPAARLLAVLAAVLLGAALSGVMLAWALPAAIALALAFVVVARQLRGLGAGAGARFFGTELPTRTLGFAGPRVISAALEQMLLWISVLVVGAVAGAAAAGVYGAASRFVAAGMIVDSAIRVVFAPVFSRMQHRGAEGEVRELHRTATSWLVLFSAPVFLLLAIFAPVALSVLGPDFASGAATLAVMCVGALVAFLAGNVQTILLTAGRSGLAAINKAVVVAVNVALIPPFVAMWGIVGAAWAWTIACVIDAVLAWCEIRFLLRVRIAPDAGLAALVACVGSVGLPAVIARTVIGPSLTGLLVAAAIGLVLFAAVCRLGRIPLRLVGFTPPAPRPPEHRRPGQHSRRSARPAHHTQKSGTP